MNKRKSEIVFKCDYCGNITSYFVTTAEYKHFIVDCWFKPAHPPFHSNGVARKY